MKLAERKMKLFLSTVIAIFGFQFAFSQSFEGVIDMTTRNPQKNETAEIEWHLKNGQHRLDYNSVSGDYTATYSLVVANNSAKLVSSTGSTTNIPIASLLKENYDLGGYYVTEQNPNQKVFGFACNKYVIQAKDYLVEYWISDNTGLSLNDFPEFMRKGLLAPVNDLQANGIPVKIQVKDVNGKMIYSQTISEVDSGSVDNSLFQVN